MARIKAIQVDDKIWEEFKSLAKEEGRIFGKMLEVLIEKYKKTKEEQNEQHNS